MTTTTTPTKHSQPAQSLHPNSESNTNTNITHIQKDNNPTTMSISKSPHRLLFISSIGNQKPYRFTRHSAGHILLDALSPILPSSLPQQSYTTWYSPSYMNESGPKLVRQLQRWFDKIDSPEGNTSWISNSGVALPLGGSNPNGAAGGAAGGGRIPATLVILHDELEAPPGKVRVKRGGPEASSLRGHRGLISICESLRGKGLYPVKSVNSNGSTSKGGRNSGGGRDLSILRVGVGIGRPESRGKNAVADYVLTEMNEKEMDAVKNAAGSILGVLEEELFFSGSTSS
ncbi:hypothetical protein PENSTE_c001G09876 [Penicillium steckii]|uniref:Peptidyl-tRNA hydrolase n=1 Tax=Penicillium steckii TaxID=303698 RepID=A0A1V6U193_9EURO|nr:hypothetical protein PENSTE_c001G09876 [Penicillium steckii]